MVEKTGCLTVCNVCLRKEFLPHHAYACLRASRDWCDTSLLSTDNQNRVELVTLEDAGDLDGLRNLRGFRRGLSKVQRYIANAPKGTDRTWVTNIVRVACLKDESGTMTAAAILRPIFCKGQRRMELVAVAGDVDAMHQVVLPTVAKRFEIDEVVADMLCWRRQTEVQLAALGYTEVVGEEAKLYLKYSLLEHDEKRRWILRQAASKAPALGHGRGACPATWYDYICAAAPQLLARLGPAAAEIDAGGEAAGPSRHEQHGRRDSAAALRVAGVHSSLPHQDVLQTVQDGGALNTSLNSNTPRSGKTSPSGNTSPTSASPETFWTPVPTCTPLSGEHLVRRTGLAAGAVAAETPRQALQLVPARTKAVATPAGAAMNGDPSLLPPGLTPSDRRREGDVFSLDRVVSLLGEMCEAACTDGCDSRDDLSKLEIALEFVKKVQPWLIAEQEALLQQLARCNLWLWQLRTNRDKSSRERAIERASNYLQSRYPGSVYGRLAALVYPKDPRYELALGVALKDHLDTVLVDTEATAYMCKQVLRRQRVPLPVFLAVEPLMAQTAPTQDPNLRLGEGERLARDMLVSKHGAGPYALHHFLRDTVICDSKEGATALASKAPWPRVVTAGGAIISKEGEASEAGASAEALSARWDYEDGVCTVKRVRLALLAEMRKILPYSLYMKVGNKIRTAKGIAESKIRDLEAGAEASALPARRRPYNSYTDGPRPHCNNRVAVAAAPLAGGGDEQPAAEGFAALPGADRTAGLCYRGMAAAWPQMQSKRQRDESTGEQGSMNLATDTSSGAKSAIGTTAADIASGSREADASTSCPAADAGVGIHGVNGSCGASDGSGRAVAQPLDAVAFKADSIGSEHSTIPIARSSALAASIAPTVPTASTSNGEAGGPASSRMDAQHADGAGQHGQTRAAARAGPVAGSQATSPVVAVYPGSYGNDRRKGNGAIDRAIGGVARNENGATAWGYGSTCSPANRAPSGRCYDAASTGGDGYNSNRSTTASGVLVRCRPYSSYAEGPRPHCDNRVAVAAVPGAGGGDEQPAAEGFAALPGADRPAGLCYRGMAAARPQIQEDPREGLPARLRRGGASPFGGVVAIPEAAGLAQAFTSPCCGDYAAGAGLRGMANASAMLGDRASPQQHPHALPSARSGRQRSIDHHFCANGGGSPLSTSTTSSGTGARPAAGAAAAAAGPSRGSRGARGGGGADITIEVAGRATGRPVVGAGLAASGAGPSGPLLGTGAFRRHRGAPGAYRTHEAVAAAAAAMAATTPGAQQQSGSPATSMGDPAHGARQQAGMPPPLPGDGPAVAGAAVGVAPGAAKPAADPRPPEGEIAEPAVRALAADGAHMVGPFPQLQLQPAGVARFPMGPAGPGRGAAELGADAHPAAGDLAAEPMRMDAPAPAAPQPAADLPPPHPHEGAQAAAHGNGFGAEAHGAAVRPAAADALDAAAAEDPDAPAAEPAGDRTARAPPLTRRVLVKGSMQLPGCFKEKLRGIREATVALDRGDHLQVIPTSCSVSHSSDKMTMRLHATCMHAVEDSGWAQAYITYARGMFIIGPALEEPVGRRFVATPAALDWLARVRSLRAPAAPAAV